MITCSSGLFTRALIRLVNYLSLLFKSYLSLNRIVCHVSHCLSGISVWAQARFVGLGYLGFRQIYLSNCNQCNRISFQSIIFYFSNLTLKELAPA